MNVKAWTSKRSLAKARASISKVEEGFGKLAHLFDTLRESDRDTTTDIVTHDGRFHRAFFCPGACSRAFGLTLRVVGVDGCHLKTKYGGVLLVATVLDGNSNIFPACIGIAEGESSESWTWFLRNARISLGLGEGDGVVVLRDMEKGLERALTDVLPLARHGLCLFHIEKNFVKKFKTNMNGVLWKTAKCTTPEEFREWIDSIEATNPAAANYIRQIDPKKWACSHFRGRRFGHLTSNIAESSNSWLEEVRRLNPTDLFACYIRKLNAFFLRGDKNTPLSCLTHSPTGFHQQSKLQSSRGELSK